MYHNPYFLHFISANEKSGTPGRASSKRKCPCKVKKTAICSPVPFSVSKIRFCPSAVKEGRELTAQIAPLVERSRKLERYYSERRAADRVSLSVSLSVNRLSERIHNTSEQGISYRHFYHTSGCFNRISLIDIVLTSEKYRTDIIFLQVQYHTVLHLVGYRRIRLCLKLR